MKSENVADGSTFSKITNDIGQGYSTSRGISDSILSFVSIINNREIAESAARIRKDEYELAAQGEELAAMARAADRNDELARAMAARIAGFGARGISALEGSPLTILEEDIRRYGRATDRDLLNTQIKTMTYRSKGKVGEILSRNSLFGLVADLTETVQTLPTEKSIKELFGIKGKDSKKED